MMRRTFLRGCAAAAPTPRPSPTTPTHTIPSPTTEGGYQAWGPSRKVLMGIATGTSSGIMALAGLPAVDPISLLQFGEAAALLPLVWVTAVNRKSPFAYFAYCAIEGIALTPALIAVVLAQMAFAAFSGSVFWTFVGPFLAVFVVWVPVAAGVLYAPEIILLLQLVAIFLVARWGNQIRRFLDGDTKKKTTWWK